MDAAKILIDAVKAVEDADVPEDLRVVAFEKAIQLLAGGGLRADGGVAGGDVAAGGEGQSGASRISSIVGATGLSSSVVSEVFEDDGESIRLIIGVGKLDDSAAGATKQIALLVAASRQLATSEEWTATTEIRDVCDEFGRFDTNNFARTVAGMDDVFSFKGKGQKREVKVNRVGVEEFKKLVNSLTGTS